MKQTILAAAVLAGVAAPAPAETLVMPAGCTADLTVQTRACAVVATWTCAGEPPGERWMGVFGSDSMQALYRVDEDFNWLSISFLDAPPVTYSLDPASPDLFDLDAMLANGSDAMDFTMVPDDDRGPFRVVGSDETTGEIEVIDGVALQLVTYRQDYLDMTGVVFDSVGGAQYLHPELRIFLSGLDWAGTEDNVTDARPVEIFAPGEAGFLDVAPRYGCGG